uniref:Uncharacterized protein n=1 Tax=Panagrolaimus sp. ES5 TaxID=591445 RepID=A0AC34F3S0_9BILA
MMYGRIFAVLIFILLPTFIYGLQCDVSVSCEKQGGGIWSVTGQPKECDACASFSCWVTHAHGVVHGSGCFDDFNKTCSSTIPTKALAVIEDNQNNYTFGNHMIMVALSNSSLENETAAYMYKELKKVVQFNKFAAGTFRSRAPALHCGITLGANGQQHLLTDNISIPLLPTTTLKSKGTQTAAFGLTGMAILALTFIFF